MYEPPASSGADVALFGMIWKCRERKDFFAPVRKVIVILSKSRPVSGGET